MGSNFRCVTERKVLVTDIPQISTSFAMLCIFLACGVKKNVEKCGENSEGIQ